MEDVKTRSEIQDEIILKALKDEQFKQVLKNDPKGLLKTEYGVEVPDDVEIQILEEQRNKLCIVIPSKPSNLDSLSDEELKGKVKLMGPMSGDMSY